MRKEANRKVMKAKHSNKNETLEITQKKKQKGEINDKNGMVKKKIFTTLTNQIHIYLLSYCLCAKGITPSSKQ